MFQNESFIL